MRPANSRWPTGKTSSLAEARNRTRAFELKKVLASGNSGLVFLAYDGKANRPAAVKVLWPEISKQEDETQRFVRAMKTMMPIRHENLVEIYAAGKNGPHCFTRNIGRFKLNSRSTYSPPEPSE